MKTTPVDDLSVRANKIGEFRPKIKKIKNEHFLVDFSINNNNNNNKNNLRHQVTALTRFQHI